MNTHRIVIAGLGTVGTGALQLLSAHQAELQQSGIRIVVVGIAARDRDKAMRMLAALPHGLDWEGESAEHAWWENAVTMAEQAEYDSCLELIGGADGIALQIAEAALRRGKDFITANKALLAFHGDRLAELPGALHQPSIRYEAAVAGGIPIIKGLSEGLAVNRIERVEGIMNGTCNYILTAMAQEGRDFAEVLAEAQELGYAEADPSTDIDGHDTAHKLALLARLVFRCPVAMQDIAIVGVRHIQAIDVNYAAKLGYSIKLLGVAERSGAGVRAEVAPMMLARTNPLASVDGVLNAVQVTTQLAGTYTLCGPGAGGHATGSAVMADLFDAAHKTPARALPANTGATGEVEAAPPRRWYLRLEVIDQPGVLASITSILRDHALSVESAIQQGRAPEEPVVLVLIIHPTRRVALDAAIARIVELPFNSGAPQRMPIIDDAAAS